MILTILILLFVVVPLLFFSSGKINFVKKLIVPGEKPGIFDVVKLIF